MNMAIDIIFFGELKMENDELEFKNDSFGND